MAKGACAFVFRYLKWTFAQRIFVSFSQPYVGFENFVYICNIIKESRDQ